MYFIDENLRFREMRVELQNRFFNYYVYYMLCFCKIFDIKKVVNFKIYVKNE